MDSAKTESDPFVGRSLDGQYEIEALIARGGMGAVYRARHTMLGDRVAIKILRPDMQTNREWLARFQREGQAARRFRHPNAVTVYDLRQTTDGAIYMVMELVEGRTLNDELKRRGRLTPAEALAVLEPVASALDAAHGMGIVHRDLKPDNVMIGGTNDEPVNAPLTVNPAQVKLLDLGIAKMREAADAGDGSGGRQLTVIGQLLGTPYYMSPEQWGETMRDENPEVDGRADIYSLGVILYELLAGRKPFGGSTLAEVRRGHTTAAPPSLSEAAPHVPASLAHIVTRALAKDRADRQPTAGELIDEMRVAIALAPSAASPNYPASNYPASPPGQASIQTLAAPASYEREARHTHAQTPAYPTNPAGVPGQTVNASASHSASGSAPVFQSSAGQYQSAQSQPFAQFPTPSLPAIAPARRSRAIPIALGVIVLFIIVGTGAAGVLAWYYMRENTSEDQGGTGRDANVNASVTTPSPSPILNATRAEALRYWMEFHPTGGTSAPVQMSGSTVRVRSGQQFQLFIAPRESGYLYIIAPGTGNVLTTFLTAQPVAQLQVDTNRIEAGETFAFPGGVGTLQLEATPGTETFTIIFSREPLTQPAFLTRESLRRLTPAELREFENFRAQYEGSAPTTTAENENNDAAKPLTVVSANETGENQPVIFDVAIQHYN